MEKKISSIIGGPIMFYIVLWLLVFCEAIGVILLCDEGLLEEGIAVTVGMLLFLGGTLVIMYCLHYLDYIIVTEKGIKSRKQFYSWEDIFIAAGYRSVGRGYVYQLYFGTEFLEDMAKIKDCKKKGLLMDINEKRLNLILQYYKKSISIVKEMEWHEKVLQMMKEHNKNYPL